MRIPARVPLFVAFVGTVWASNWALERYGLVDIGPWQAPAGVYFAGLAFGLRDALHETGGRVWVLTAIAEGAALSWWLSDGASIPGGVTSIAVASGAAFALSELADLTVYEPLRERNWTAVVLASGAVGAVVDSCLFLWLAFGTVDNLAGLLAGKGLMILLAVPLVGWVRRARPICWACDGATDETVHTCRELGG